MIRSATDRGFGRPRPAPADESLRLLFRKPGPCRVTSDVDELERIFNDAAKFKAWADQSQDGSLRLWLRPPGCDFELWTLDF